MTFRPSNAWWWRCRLISKGPSVGVMTWYGPPYIAGEELDRHHRFQALVGGETTARMILYGDMTPIDVEGRQLRNLERISEPDYQFLLAHAAYSIAHAPHLPDASPKQAIDWAKSRPIF